MTTNIPVRITELIIYMLFAANYAAGYVAGAGSATISFLMYCFLLYANVQKYSTYITGTKERDI
jgi:hypothetical protein